MLLTSKKYIKISIIAFSLLMMIYSSVGVLSTPDSVHAYRFSVPQEIVEVTINLDGSTTIEYWITFQRESGGQAIDVVDIGFPNRRYDLDSVVADLDGNTLTDIRKSEEISIGVEIWLHSNTIYNNGTLHVRCNQPYMVYEDTEDVDMASCEFGNTWWDSKYTSGTTNLTTRIVFPSTVGNDTYTKYHYSHQPDRNFTLSDGKLVFEWNEPSANPYQQYKYGVSFPKEGVKWFTGIPPSPEEILLMVAIVVLFIGAIVIPIVACTINYRRKRTRLMDYIPPFVSVPTAGPRTDLKREEVAIILEKPIKVTIAMITLNLVQKNLLEPLSTESPHLTPVLGTSKRGLRTYERHFLESIDENHVPEEKKLIKAISSLVKTTRRRVKGYSYEKTVDHYEELICKSVERIKLNSDFQKIASEDWYWAVLNDEFLPEFEIKLDEYKKQRETGYYYEDDSWFWYYHYHYNHWHWVPSGRSFTEKVTRKSYPIPKRSRSRGGSSRGSSCACACAGCACACAGGGR